MLVFISFAQINFTQLYRFVSTNYELIGRNGFAYMIVRTNHNLTREYFRCGDASHFEPSNWGSCYHFHPGNKNHTIFYYVCCWIQLTGKTFFKQLVDGVILLFQFVLCWYFMPIFIVSVTISSFFFCANEHMS